MKVTLFILNSPRTKAQGESRASGMLTRKTPVRVPACMVDGETNIVFVTRLVYACEGGRVDLHDILEPLGARCDPNR